MQIVVCLDIEDGFALIEQMARLASLRDASVELLHVIDVAERDELEGALRPGLVRPRVAEASADALRSERSALHDVYRQAEELLVKRGAAKVTLSIGQGRPERAIVARLQNLNANLCVLARRSDRLESPDVGPKSVGHVARFALDHAPCAVLLLR